MQLCLVRDPQERAKAADLLEHAWIVKWVEKKEIWYESKREMAQNLVTFRKASILQSGVMSFIGGLLTQA